MTISPVSHRTVDAHHPSFRSENFQNSLREAADRLTPQPRVAPFESIGAAHDDLKSNDSEGDGGSSKRLTAKNTQQVDEPPSLFKKFLFDPLIEVLRVSLWMVFSIFDLLRQFAYSKEIIQKPNVLPGVHQDQKGQKASQFLGRLRSAPRSEQILIEFENLFSSQEKDEIYRLIGEVYQNRVGWKEMIWSRTPQQNIALGRRLVHQNPLLISERLIGRLEQLSIP